MPLSSTVPDVPPVVPEEILDWESRLEKAPVRPQSTIHVRISYVGRSRPLPVADPDTE